MGRRHALAPAPKRWADSSHKKFIYRKISCGGRAKYGLILAVKPQKYSANHPAL